MKISMQWLQEWVTLRQNAEALAVRLTLAGIEVGSAAPVSPNLDRVVVGEIISLSPHPQADQLRVCQVNVGQRAPLTIVCGAVHLSYWFVIIRLNNMHHLINAQFPAF